MNGTGGVYSKYAGGKFKATYRGADNGERK